MRKYTYSEKVPYPIEHRVASRQKRQKIQDIVLTSILAATGIGLAVVAPNSVQLLAYVQKYVGPSKKIDRRLYQALSRLRTNGLITKRNTLTANGKKRAVTLSKIDEIAPKIPFRWDGKWRIVMFDIWEHRRAVRDRLRGMLERMGFVQFQKSAWVYPYPCEELFAYLRSELRLGTGIRYMVVEEMDTDISLRKVFNLRT